jgi:hypothetical protein
MHPLPAALALGAAFVLASALPAHAGDGAVSPDAPHAASRPPSFAATLVRRPEAPGLVLPRIREDESLLENERGGSQPEARGSDSLEADRARPKAKLAVGRPKGASVTTGSSSLQPRAGWLGVTLQF